MSSLPNTYFKPFVLSLASYRQDITSKLCPAHGLAKTLVTSLLIMLLPNIPFSVTAATGNDVRLAKLNDEQLLLAGNDYVQKRNMADSALFCYDLMLSRYKGRKYLTNKQYKNLNIAFNNAYNVCMFCIYDYGRALDYLVTAQDLFKGNEPVSLLFNLGSMTNFYAQCFPTKENISLSNKYYKAAFFKAFNGCEWQTACISFLNIWGFGFGKDVIAANMDVMRKFTQIPPSKHREYSFASALFNAIDKLRKGEKTAAVNELRRTYRKANALNENKRTQCLMLWYLTQIFASCGQADSTAHYARVLEREAQGEDLKDFEVDACEMLYNYNKKEGNQDAAKEYRLKYYEKRDSILVLRNLNTMRSNFLLHSLKGATQEVDSLKQERKLQNIIVAVVSFATIVISLLLLYMYRNNRRLKESNLILYKKNEEAITREEKLEKLLNKHVNVDEKPKYQGSMLDEETKTYFYNKAISVITSREEVYQDDFNLESLAKLCGTSYKKLSQIINERYGNSFSVFLSEYRIKEACKRIGDFEHYGNLTIEAIGISVGFKARGSFFRAFKRVTGLTPSEYQSIARKQAVNEIRI